MIKKYLSRGQGVKILPIFEFQLLCNQYAKSAELIFSVYFHIFLLFFVIQVQFGSILKGTSIRLKLMLILLIIFFLQIILCKFADKGGTLKKEVEISPYIKFLRSHQMRSYIISERFKTQTMYNIVYKHCNPIFYEVVFAKEVKSGIFDPPPPETTQFIRYPH